ncbi:MAG: DsbA family protein [Deltaproteobacteria bacterium]|nr:DsbA family protein [Deltaproteobacteria bacterium]
MKPLLCSSLALSLVLSLSGCSTGGVQQSGVAEGDSLSTRPEAIRLCKLAKLELEAKEGERLVGLAHEASCPCSEIRGSLGECAHRCVRGPFALRALGRYIRRGLSDSKVASLLLERFGPRQRERIDVAKAPCRGAATASVTLVVFSDFQCPFCSVAGRMLGELEKRAGEKLRICFKSFLIHKEAEHAAHAAFAAHLQGKFWPFHDVLFANLGAQEKDDLLAYAKDLGLDVPRLERDMQGAAVMNAVLRDGLQARALRLRGTPAFFLNGRPFTDPKNLPTFLDWIEEEIAVAAASLASSQPTSLPGNAGVQ